MQAAFGGLLPRALSEQYPSMHSSLERCHSRLGCPGWGVLGSLHHVTIVFWSHTALANTS